jgi:hypothetical protein
LRKQADHYGPEDATRARALADRMDTVANAALGEMGAGEFKNYKQVPNTARYGRLRGLWVRKEIYEDLVGAGSMHVEDPGFVQKVFADVMLVYWLLEDVQTDWQQDADLIETGLGARRAADLASGRLHFARRQAVLAWQTPHGWTAPAFATILAALNDTVRAAVPSPTDQGRNP